MAALPHRPDRVDDKTRIEPKGLRHRALARRNLTDLFALLKEAVPASCFVDRLVRSAPDDGARVGRVDDCVGFYVCDVVSYDPKWHGGLLLFLLSKLYHACSRYAILSEAGGPIILP